MYKIRCLIIVKWQVNSVCEWVCVHIQTSNANLNAGQILITNCFLFSICFILIQCSVVDFETKNKLTMKSCKIDHIGNKLWAFFGFLTVIASIIYFSWSTYTFSGYKNDLTHQSNESHLVGDEIVKKDGACIVSHKLSTLILIQIEF